MPNELNDHKPQVSNFEAPSNTWVNSIQTPTYKNIKDDSSTVTTWSN